MKRIAALALALSLLLACTAAGAETMGTRLDLEHIRLTPVGGESDDDNKVRLHDMMFSLSVGVVDGAPTLQAILSYGEGQELDSVLQIVDNRLLICMGGISGTYSVDLDELFGEGKGGLAGAAIGTAMGMFAAKPDMVMDMSMPKSEKGYRRLNVKIPRATYRDATKRLLKLLKSTKAVPKETRQALKETLNASKRALKISLLYNTNADKVRVRVTRGGKGVQLKAEMHITTEPMDFIDLRNDPEIHDLLHLDKETRTTLRDELDFLFMKSDFFARDIHLDRLTTE